MSVSNNSVVSSQRARLLFPLQDNGVESQGSFSRSYPSFANSIYRDPISADHKRVYVRHSDGSFDELWARVSKKFTCDMKDFMFSYFNKSSMDWSVLCLKLLDKILINEQDGSVTDEILDHIKVFRDIEISSIQTIVDHFDVVSSHVLDLSQRFDVAKLLKCFSLTHANTFKVVVLDNINHLCQNPTESSEWIRTFLSSDYSSIDMLFKIVLELSQNNRSISLEDLKILCSLEPNSLRILSKNVLRFEEVIERKKQLHSFLKFFQSPSPIDLELSFVVTNVYSQLLKSGDYDAFSKALVQSFSQQQTDRSSFFQSRLLQSYSDDQSQHLKQQIRKSLDGFDSFISTTAEFYKNQAVDYRSKDFLSFIQIKDFIKVFASKSPPEIRNRVYASHKLLEKFSAEDRKKYFPYFLFEFFAVSGTEALFKTILKLTEGVNDPDAMLTILRSSTRYQHHCQSSIAAEVSAWENDFQEIIQKRMDANFSGNPFQYIRSMLKDPDKACAYEKILNEILAGPDPFDD